MTATIAHPAFDLIHEALSAIAATAGHQPGEPYRLSRRAFALMALGLDLGQEPDPEEDGYDAPMEYRAALWGAIASFEARRWFTDDNRCPSSVELTTEGQGGLCWEYATTSNTTYRAEEARVVGGLSLFEVTIPEERDQPGRTAWSYLRLAMAGWIELESYNIHREDASPTPVQLARIALTRALFSGDPAAAPQHLEALLVDLAHA